MIGIIGAMAEEVAQLKEAMEQAAVETRASMDFYKGRLQGKDVVVVQSGIGKVNAGICTQILADVYHADAVINTGIAHKEAGVGQVGAGTVRAPLGCFENALTAYAKKLGIDVD